MWVFGYGSLMWDGWENNRNCTRRVEADLPGYCRKFNKASVVNWGTDSSPGPTLNLSRVDGGVCRGIAFQFPNSQEAELRSYLEQREGKAFPLRQVLVRIHGQPEVPALVPLYKGKNIIAKDAVADLAKMVLAASGTSGTCLEYVHGVAKALDKMGIDDPAVTELWREVNYIITVPSRHSSG